MKLIEVLITQNQWGSVSTEDFFKSSLEFILNGDLIAIPNDMGGRRTPGGSRTEVCSRTCSKCSRAASWLAVCCCSCSWEFSHAVACPALEGPAPTNACSGLWELFSTPPPPLEDYFSAGAWAALEGSSSGNACHGPWEFFSVSPPPLEDYSSAGAWAALEGSLASLPSATYVHLKLFFYSVSNWFTSAMALQGLFHRFSDKSEFLSQIKIMT